MAETTQPFLMHALSPLHAGVGHSVGVIDLPIARMKATGIPVVPGSSIKGVLRDARRGHGDLIKTFGPENAEHAGALVVGDARLLALPVRSFKGTFAWVTSPLLLLLAKQDLKCELEVPRPAETGAIVPHDRCLLDGKIYLQDLDLVASADSNEIGKVKLWTEKLRPYVCSVVAEDYFSERFVVVDNETMTFLWETATQVDMRNRLDSATHTTVKGALWSEESLPPETLLIGLMDAHDSRGTGLDKVLDCALPKGENVLQFGGKATVGRGRCRIQRMGSGAGHV